MRTVPWPQQIIPMLAQSGVPAHSQSVESKMGHCVPTATHVDAAQAFSGGSQQCWPAVQSMFLPPSTPLKGQ
jgi:hypothetical protein